MNQIDVANALLSIESTELRDVGVTLIIKTILIKDDYENARTWANNIEEEAVRNGTLDSITSSEAIAILMDRRNYDRSIEVATGISDSNARQRAFYQLTNIEVDSLRRAERYDEAWDLIPLIQDTVKRSNRTNELAVSHVRSLLEADEVDKAKDIANLIDSERHRERAHALFEHDEPAD